MKRNAPPSKTGKLAPKQFADLWSLPTLATPEQIASALQCTSRTVLNWEKAGVIRAAFRRGKIIRFSPWDVACALGLTPPSANEGERLGSTSAGSGDDAGDQ